MTYYFRNSKISQLIQLAFKQNFDDLGKKLLAYHYEDYITDDVEIRYTENVALLEEIIRTITDLDILFNEFGGVFTVLDVPEGKRDYITWFVKLFAFIESESSNWELSEWDKTFPANDHHRKVFEDARIDFNLDISGMKFLYYNVHVEFLNSEN